MQHLDEGTIHAWLDGALGAEESAQVEQHAAECAACAAAVAEARGLIAGASRLLSALDSVPGGVIPRADNAALPTLAEARAANAARPNRAPGQGTLWRMLRVTPARAAAAAVLIVALGTTYTLSHESVDTQMAVVRTIAPLAATDSQSEVPQSAARDQAVVVTGGASQSAPSAPTAAPVPAPAPPPPPSALQSRIGAIAGSGTASGAAAGARKEVASAQPSERRAARAGRPGTEAKALEEPMRTVPTAPTMNKTVATAIDTARALDSTRDRSIADVAAAAPSPRLARPNAIARAAVPPTLNQAAAAAAPAAGNAAGFASAAGCYTVIGAGSRVPALLALEPASADGRSAERAASAPVAAQSASVARGTVSTVGERGSARRIEGASWTTLPDSGGTLAIVLSRPGEPMLELRVNVSSLVGTLRDDRREVPITLQRGSCAR